MQYLCLHLPNLALDVFTRCSEAPLTPFVVSQRDRHRECVLACNAPAAQAGIQSGMPLNAAHALSENLQVKARDSAAEHLALERLAAWAYQYTSFVSIQRPFSLQLEVGGSLRLFGGMDALKEHLRTDLNALGYEVQLAAAPTPLGAWLLAKSGNEIWLNKNHELLPAVANIALEHLSLPKEITAGLRGIGLRTIREILRLPRAELSKRFGKDLLLTLDRLLGQAADPREPYQMPAQFESELVLPAATEKAQALLFAARRLLNELHGYLQARQKGVQEMLWVFEPEVGPTTRLTLSLLEPSRNVDRLFRLLQARLENQVLAAPAQRLGLCALALHPLAEEESDFWRQGSHQNDNWQALVERLRGRLGQEGVQGVCLFGDHLPERTTRYCEPGSHALLTQTAWLPRPPWLLARPALLETRQRRPYYNGPLQLIAGPERIEAGWWRHQDHTRDYYIARNQQGEYFWLYHELKAPEKWYLHGIFA